MNSAGIKITRHPYEEPYHLNLWIEASNGILNGRLEYYTTTKDIKILGNKLLNYLGNKGQNVTCEIGSEDPLARSFCFLSMKIMPLDMTGHGVIWLRFNNNRLPPWNEVSEFCICVDVADVNRLGSLLVGFGELEHQVLHWSVKDGKLFKTIENFEVSN